MKQKLAEGFQFCLQWHLPNKTMEQSGDSVTSADDGVPNITTAVGSKPEVDLTFIWIWPVLITVIALGLLGNCLILYAIWTVEKFRRSVILVTFQYLHQVHFSSFQINNAKYQF